MRGETTQIKPICIAVVFQSTPLMRGETRTSDKLDHSSTFQSTPLMRGETQNIIPSPSFRHISIHSPHARGDPLPTCSTSKIRDFNPLPSCEGRRGNQSFFFLHTHFNPLPSCEGRRAAWRRLPCGCRISIHSPHARGDLKDGGRFGRGLISIHSPHARGDIHNFFANNSLNNFNPLPSCEGRLSGAT